MLGSKSLAGIIGALIAMLLLQGCSAIKIGYGQAPDLLYWWLDSYFDVTEAQTPRLRDELARFHQWHRREELPRYASLLQKVQQMAPGDVSAEQVCRVWDEVRGMAGRLAERAMEPAAELASTLAPAQLEHARRKFDKGNEEFVQDFQRGSPAQRRERRLKAAIERTETWYGRLEEPQLAVLRSTIDNSVFDAGLSLQERNRRQQDMLQTLRKLGTDRATAVQARAALSGLVQRSWDSPDARQRAYAERNTAHACASVALVHNSTSNEQRARLVQTLKGYETDLRSLAGS